MGRNQQPRHVAKARYELLLETRLGSHESPARLNELFAAGRGDAQRVLRDPIKGQEGVVIEDDRAQLGRFDERFPEAVVDRTLWKARVVLLARKALLLCGSDDSPSLTSTAAES
jgi:hypothetical protein